MRLRWEGETAYADRPYIAALYEVSEMTVRRHCTPAFHEPRAGAGTGVAMYDVEACAGWLAGVAPRPHTTVAMIRTRNATARLRAERRRREAGGT